MDESPITFAEGFPAFRLPTCIQQLLRFIYPTIDWRHVAFFNRLPWWLPETGQDATTLPSANSRDIHVFFDGGKLAPPSAVHGELIYPNDLNRICDAGSSDHLLTMLVHECVHVLQMQEESTDLDIGYVRGSTFYYLQCWACHGFTYDENLPHEKEAYDQDAKFTACLQSVGLVNANWCLGCSPPSGGGRGALDTLVESKCGLDLVKRTSVRWTCCDSGGAALLAGVAAVAIGIALTVAKVFIVIADFISDVFNSTEDDRVRDDIRTSSPSGLAARTDAELAEMVRRLFDGPTGDDDERAVLRLLSCLPCPRVAALVGAFGVQNFLDEFQGEEYGQLQFMLLNCGVLSLSSLDDDGVRALVNTSGCAAINTASVFVLSELFTQLLSGSTGDEDEQTINTMMQCLPAATIRAVLRRSGTSWDDFDSAIQGSEWTTFLAIMAAKGIQAP